MNVHNTIFVISLILSCVFVPILNKEINFSNDINTEKDNSFIDIIHKASSSDQQIEDLMTHNLNTIKRVIEEGESISKINSLINKLIDLQVNIKKSINEINYNNDNKRFYFDKRSSYIMNKFISTYKLPLLMLCFICIVLILILAIIMNNSKKDQSPINFIKNNNFALKTLDKDLVFEANHLDNSKPINLSIDIEEREEYNKILENI